jgi:aspartate kinase
LIDADMLIITDRTHGNASPIWELTTARCRESLLPALESGIVPVVGSFIGATKESVLTTLGRGGSDYSAAIIGAALQVDEIQIWTDVNGVMTADPRIVAGARTLPEIKYEEIAELAYFGAKVLHPKTVAPALQQNIVLRVLNTFNPDHPGTRIVQRSEDGDKGAVKAIAAIRQMNLITVEGRGMMGVPGIAARAFAGVAAVNGNVLMISQSSSEQNICFVVPQNVAASVVAALQKEFERELLHNHIHRISGHEDIVIVAVVGSGMKGTPGIAAKVFTALADKNINVIAIAQGSSETNISLVVAGKDADQAVCAIHEAFALHRGAH